jgi:hypothetical protein
MRKTKHTDTFSPPSGGAGGGFTIAIDLGGTLIKIGLINDGELIDRREIVAQSASGLKSQLPELELVIDQILLVNQIQKENVLGIGFSFAGLVDSIANRILSTNQKYDDGPETDLVGWAHKRWNWPLYAMNDARMALLGEWQHGAGQGCSDLVETLAVILWSIIKDRSVPAGTLAVSRLKHRPGVCHLYLKSIRNFLKV